MFDIYFKQDNTYMLLIPSLLDNSIVLSYVVATHTVSECFPYEQIRHLKPRIIHFLIGKDRPIKSSHAAQ